MPDRYFKVGRKGDDLCYYVRSGSARTAVHEVEELVGPMGQGLTIAEVTLEQIPDSAGILPDDPRTFE